MITPYQTQHLTTSVHRYFTKRKGVERIEALKTLVEQMTPATTQADGQTDAGLRQAVVETLWHILQSDSKAMKPLVRQFLTSACELGETTSEQDCLNRLERRLRQTGWLPESVAPAL